MQTLILNGSPRRNGDTAALLDVMRRHLDGEVRVFSPYHDAIAPCTDCRHCWHSPGCAIRDAMDEVYHCIENFDTIVIATPLYFSLPTPPLLAVGSRLQTYYAARRFRGGPVPMLKKNGVLVLTGGGDGGPNPRLAHSVGSCGSGAPLRDAPHRAWVRGVHSVGHRSSIDPAPARNAAGSLFGLMRATCVAEVTSLHTDTLPAAEDAEALSAAKNAALLLNRLGSTKR